MGQQPASSIHALERLKSLSADVCFQCSRCTAGCPLAATMDLTPSQIVHDLLLDDVDRVLRSDAIWNCVHCETCTARCPQGVDVSGLLMWARAESWRSGKVRPDQPVASYFASFAENLYLYGRSAELPLTLMHKVKSEDYMRDIPLGFRMISRGLLPFFSRPKHAATFRRLADRARRKESERS